MKAEITSQAEYKGYTIYTLSNGQYMVSINRQPFYRNTLREITALVDEVKIN